MNFLIEIINKASGMIGIFDSGIGGLSVYREIKKFSPEKIMYIMPTMRTALMGKRLKNT